MTLPAVPNVGKTKDVADAGALAAAAGAKPKAGAAEVTGQPGVGLVVE